MASTTTDGIARPAAVVLASPRRERGISYVTHDMDGHTVQVDVYGNATVIKDETGCLCGPLVMLFGILVWPVAAIIKLMIKAFTKISARRRTTNNTTAAAGTASAQDNELGTINRTNSLGSSTIVDARPYPIRVSSRVNMEPGVLGSTDSNCPDRDLLNAAAFRR